jgi:hypothetical protein
MEQLMEQLILSLFKASSLEPRKREMLQANFPRNSLFNFSLFSPSNFFSSEPRGQNLRNEGEGNSLEQEKKGVVIEV